MWRRWYYYQENRITSYKTVEKGVSIIRSVNRYFLDLNLIT